MLSVAHTVFAVLLLSYTFPRDDTYSQLLVCIYSTNTLTWYYFFKGRKQEGLRGGGLGSVLIIRDIVYTLYIINCSTK
jgi:hypothetical protein